MERNGSNGDLYRDLLGKLTKDTSRYIPAAILPALLSIAGVSIFTRLFTDLEYGRYAVVIAAVTILTAVISGWLQQSVLRYLQRYKSANKLGEFAGKLLEVLFGIALTVVVLSSIVYAAIRSHLGGYSPFYVPAVLLIVCEVFFLSLCSFFQAEHRSKEFSLFKILNATLRLTFILVIILLIKRDVVGILIGAVAAHVIVVFPMIQRLIRWESIRAPFRSIDISFFKMIALYGFPLVGYMLCGQILSISDRFILSALKGNAQVGIYSANYNLVRMGFALVSGPILTAIQPLVISAWEQGKKSHVPNIMREFSRYYALAIFPFAVFIAVCSREIVWLMLGNDFREGYTIVPFVLLGMTAWGVAMIGHKGMEILEKTRWMLIFVFITACVNIALNLVFIPGFGYNGAAYATCLSYLIYPVLVYFYAKSAIPWRIPWRDVGKIVLASIVMGIAVYAFKHFMWSRAHPALTLAMAALCGGPLYAACLLLLKGIRPYEREVFRKQE